jgi:hypothetical protein
MQAGHDCLKSFAVIFDDADYTRQRRGFPRVEILQQAIR